MRIYTKTGDGGETSLYGGQRVKKSDTRLEAYGTVDELNAALGLVLAQPDAAVYRGSLKEIQADLFILGTELAAASGEAVNGLKLLTEARVNELEQEMDKLAQELPELTHFVFPGGNLVASYLHQARTICRRAERATVKLSEIEKIRPVAVQYLNRLADYLFMLARHANAKLPGGKEELWLGREQ
ncbi:MAG: cob(I)yrinic acid a,c-diamide adenosyltransferase [Patescibacteria group bacterium]